MIILVTGGTGFIGSHLVHKLLKLKHKVILLKRRMSDTWRINDVLKQCFIYNSDDNLEKVFRENKIDIIIHLATKYVKFHKHSKEAKEIINTNITFPTLLLDLAVKYKVNGFINTGTCFEYRLTNKKLKETDKIEPYNFYAASKIAFEEVLKFYSKNYKINAVTLKLFYPYGEKDNQKLISLVITALLQKQKLCLNSGKQKLNFTYISDIVDAYIKVLNFIFSSEYTSYEVFNTGADKAYSVRQIVHYLQKIYHDKGDINFGTSSHKNKDIKHMNCNNQKAKRLLNWQPKVNLATGLDKTYNYSISKLSEFN